MPRVWVLQHAGPETLGTIAEALNADGVSFDYVRSFQGEPVPKEMAGARGLILMGGPMGVYEEDRHPFLRQEMCLIEGALREEKPILGVCLGSQLLAAALGARVYKGKRKEIGWYPIRLKGAAQTDPLWKNLPSDFTAYHWHGDIFDLPQGAASLASSDLTEHQAFRYGSNAYGFLFHMEVTEELVRSMVQTFADELKEAQGDGREVIAKIPAHLPALQKIGQTVFRRWAGLVSKSVSAVLFLTLGLFTAMEARAERLLYDSADGTKAFVSGSVLARMENWHWFEAGPDFSNEYTYVFKTTRLAARLERPHLNCFVQGQYTQFVGLPGEAVAPGARGALGLGGTYFQHAGEHSPGWLWIKQLYADLKDLRVPALATFSSRIGRFEYFDGLETLSGDPKIDWLKKARASEKLIGPFGFSAFQRTFDGVQANADASKLFLHFFAFRPTQGGFEERAGETINTLGLLGTSATIKKSVFLPRTEERLFFYRYVDERNVSQRVDNVRPTASKADIDVNTYGVQAAGAYPIGPGEADLLFQSLWQTGGWYELEHRAFGWQLEGGYQWKKLPLEPWIRTGFLLGSGDNDPTDGRHGTFFQMLPTARKFAQFPIYNLMNSEDTFAQVLLKPAKTWGLRADWHWLRLDEPADRFYSGAGATQEKGSLFGYAGRPSNNKRNLGHLLDAAVTVTPRPDVTLVVYAGHFWGGNVIDAIYSGTNANFVYTEAEFRF